MTVLKIGFHEMLFPDEVDVAKLVKMLSKGVSCSLEEHRSRVVLKEDKYFELSMRVVRKGTKVVQQVAEDAPEEEVELAPKRRAPKSEPIIPRPRRNALPAPRQQTLLLGGPRPRE
jgi:hypothetical protein